MEVPRGFEPFVDQSRREHGLVIAGGVLACLVGYVGAAVVLFGIDALDHGAPDGPLRTASVAGSLACWGYYTIAFIRGRGGPVTDVLVYPIATVALAPFTFRWVAFGPDWSGLRGRVEFVLFDVGLFVDGVALLVPGLALCMTLLALWASRLDEAGVRAWQRRHLSPSFRDAFVDGDDGP